MRETEERSINECTRRNGDHEDVLNTHAQTAAKEKENEVVQGPSSRPYQATPTPSDIYLPLFTHCNIQWFNRARAKQSRQLGPQLGLRSPKPQTTQCPSKEWTRSNLSS
ncbi:hypothetical protein CLAIMM_13848 [Cladophialophora immunda]|nr:hypothetical protein CLAIMM_13848 [Cladophialophora immunda]